MNNSASEVEILLSTYNGEKFLKLFLDSIFLQSYKNFKLIIRDDGSTDNTLNILNNYIYKYDNISLIKGVNIGWKGSFNELITHSKGKIVFFADQDDIWYPSKIEYIVNKFNSVEQNYKIFVHFADIIDDDGKVLSRSTFLGENSLLKMKIIGSRGGAHGCCMCVDGELLRNINYHSRAAFVVGHDFPVTAYGIINKKIYYINNSLIAWRAHSTNSSVYYKFKFRIFLNGILLSFSYSKLKSSKVFFPYNFSIYYFVFILKLINRWILK